MCDVCTERCDKPHWPPIISLRVFSLFIYYYYYRLRYYIIIILILHTSGVSDNIIIYLNAVSITFHGGCYDILFIYYYIVYLWSGRGQVVDPRLYNNNKNNSNTIIYRYDIIFHVGTCACIVMRCTYNIMNCYYAVCSAPQVS